MNSQEYIEVSIRIAPFSEEAAEIVMAEVAELPYEAFTVEAPCLRCYVQKERYRPSDLKAVLSGMAGMGLAVDFSADLVRGTNWNRAWEERLEPVVVEGTVTVKAPDRRDVPRTRFNVLIDPLMAFGTAAHETTYMMVTLLLGTEAAVRGRVVLDMGCGTALLGILAAKMGAARVYAIDIDAVAARSAWENARRNRVGRRVETYCGDASLLQMGKYDVILANINRNTLLEDLPTYVRSLRRGGTLCMSGFYVSDVLRLKEAAAGLGLVGAGGLERGDWASLKFLKNP